MSKVIGIDLGTTYSAVATINEAGVPAIIENKEGARTTPSVISIKDGERVVGKLAKNKATMLPKNTISFIKRFMGTPYNDKDAQTMMKQIGYDVVKDSSGMCRVKIEDREYTPEEISAITLGYLRQAAEDYYGCEVKDAVITVPAWFNEDQRKATIVAGQIAGLNVLRIINEPTAAILNSNIELKAGEDKNVLVVDLGGGTCDCTFCNIFKSDESSETIYEVMSNKGDVFLGGQNFDNAIIEWVMSEFKKDNGIDLHNDYLALARIQEAAEKAKCELSNATQTEINLPYITVKDGMPMHANYTLNRAKYDELTDELVNRVVTCAKDAVSAAKKSAKDIDEVLLVGGMTRSINVQTALEKEFGIKPNKSLNPDEAVALGAAIQANILAGDTTVGKDILLLDVTPLSLGIEAEHGIFVKMIEANTTIPTKKSEIFSTAVDNQPSVEIHILQGEREMANDNHSLGRFMLDGIPMAKRGVPQIEVTFDVDANGILKVTAKDKGTGKEQSISISGGSGLSTEEIERMKAEAEAHKAEDKAKREKIDKLNECESYAYNVRSNIEDEKVASTLSQEKKDKLTNGVNEVLDATKSGDLDKATTAKSALENEFKDVLAELYKKQNGGNGDVKMDVPEGFEDLFKKGGFNTANAQTAKTADEPTDVDFEEVK